jgi:hypothetical protein
VTYGGANGGSFDVRSLADDDAWSVFDMACITYILVDRTLIIILYGGGGLTLAIGQRFHRSVGFGNDRK